MEFEERVRDAADPHEVAALASILTNTARHTRQYFDKAAWDPAPYSPAARDLANDELRRDGTPWGEQPVLEVISYLSITAFAVIDHVHSIAKLMEGDEPSLYGPAALARAAAETAGKATWLTAPEGDVRDRVARQIAFRIGSLEAQVEQLKNLGADAAEALTEKKARRLEASQSVDELGVDRLDSPGLTTLVKEVLARVHIDAGVVVYKYLSDATHGRATSLYTAIADVDEQGTGMTMPTMDLYEVPADVALMSLIAAFSELVKYMGWDPWAWQAWVRGAMKKRSSSGLRAAQNS
jgi:hypothetical protein